MTSNPQSATPDTFESALGPLSPKARFDYVSHLMAIAGVRNEPVMMGLYEVLRPKIFEGTDWPATLSSSEAATVAAATMIALAKNDPGEAVRWLLDARWPAETLGTPPRSDGDVREILGRPQ